MTWADTRLHIVLVVCATLLYGGSHPLGGEEGPEKDRERQLVEAWYETYDSIVESFEVRSDDGRVEDGGLQRETILTVYNPEFSMRHGRIYLWTDEGRPTVIGSIMSGITARSSGIRAINYEFHSLARRPVSVGRAGTVYWKCEKPGVEWSTVSTGKPPAASRAARLTQMRMIARQFTARSRANRFRLMPQPIYRYPGDTPGVTDGAIFSFALATDPCVYLLIEAKNDSWSVAFARSNRNDLTVSDGASDVWSVEELIDTNPVQTGPFYLLWFAERRRSAASDEILTRAWRE